MNELQTLRSIEAKATPGRWLRDGSTDIFAGGCGCTGELVVTSAPQRGPEVTDAQRANAEAIVAMRNVFPALLDVAEFAERALTDRDADPAVGVALADDLADALDRLRAVAAVSAGKG